MKKRKSEDNDRELDNNRLEKKTGLAPQFQENTLTDQQDKLLDAFIENNISDFKRALEEGANPDMIVNTDLLITHIVSKDQIEMLEAVIEHKADVTLLNLSGTSCLDYTTHQSKKEIIKLLVKNGATFTNKASSDNMFFGYVYKNDIDMVKFLLTNGIDSKIFTPDKNTAIDIAIGSNNTQMLETVLSYGMRPDFKAPFKETPLISSVKNENIDVVNILLKHGANYKVKNQKGLEPIELARELENKTIEHLIGCYMNGDLIDTGIMPFGEIGFLEETTEHKDLL